MPPSSSRNRDSRLDVETIPNCDRLKPDVVGIFQHRNDAASIKADIELPRQAVKGAVVEDVEMPFARVGPGIDQLLRVDTRCRGAGDVADVVRPRAARAQSQVLDRLQESDRILRLDFAHLKVSARRYVRVATGVAIGEVAHSRELPMIENAVGDAQPAHVRRLIRCAVEQTIEAPAEVVGCLRRLVIDRLLLQLLIGIERVQLALEFLRIG